MNPLPVVFLADQKTIRFGYIIESMSGSDQVKVLTKQGVRIISAHNSLIDILGHKDTNIFGVPSSRKFIRRVNKDLENILKKSKAEIRTSPSGKVDMEFPTKALARYMSGALQRHFQTITVTQENKKITVVWKR